MPKKYVYKLYYKSGKIENTHLVEADSLDEALTKLYSLLGAVRVYNYITYIRDNTWLSQ